MPATWPTSLPNRFDQQGFSEGLGDGRLVTNMEAGVAKIRNRFRPSRPMNGTMELSSVQLDALRSFVLSDLSGGSLPFLFPNQSGTGTVLCRIGSDMPSWSWLGLKNGLETWRVSIALEILP